jgi:hypothetical protein
MIRGLFVTGDLSPCVATLDLRPEELLSGDGVVAPGVDDPFSAKQLLLLAHVITETFGSLRDR